MSEGHEIQYIAKAFGVTCEEAQERLNRAYERDASVARGESEALRNQLKDCQERFKRVLGAFLLNDKG